MKIAVLVSGGVDSSVALALLKEQGHEVTAFYLKIWLEDELSFLGTCPWEDDLQYVRAVCEQLQVPLEVVSLQQEYHDHIVAYTIAEVQAGRTPNPDVMCNKHVKFGFFFEKLREKFDKVASGHYGQVVEMHGKAVLKRAPDEIKDQTYFLSRLSQHQVAQLMFPIGHLVKDEVRALAYRFNLPNRDRKDSQGLCFLGKIKFSDFLKHYLGELPGDLIEIETGKKWGTHKGFWYHTIGQRQGIGLSHGPWYVADKDPVKNIVYISRTYHADDKPRDQFLATDCHWISGQAPEKRDLTVKMRHGKYEHACVISPAGHTTFHVKLADRDQGIAPGQFAVFYDGDVCLGSGVIAPIS